MNQTLNCFDIFYNLFIATFCHSSPSTIVFDKTFGRKSYFIFSFQFKFKFELELQMLPFHGFDYDLHLQCLLCVCMCGAVLFRYSTFAHSMCHFMPHFYISSNYYWTFRNANEHHLGWLQSSAKSHLAESKIELFQKKSTRMEEKRSAISIGNLLEISDKFYAIETFAYALLSLCFVCLYLFSACTPPTSPPPPQNDYLSRKCSAESCVLCYQCYANMIIYKRIVVQMFCFHMLSHEVEMMMQVGVIRLGQVQAQAGARLGVKMGRWCVDYGISCRCMYAVLWTQKISVC